MGIINTAQNIARAVITVLITMTETSGVEEITSIIRITGMMMIIELITMKEEIITIIPSTEEYIKGSSINLMY